MHAVELVYPANASQHMPMDMIVTNVHHCVSVLATIDPASRGTTRAAHQMQLQPYLLTHDRAQAFADSAQA